MKEAIGYTLAVMIVGAGIVGMVKIRKTKSRLAAEEAAEKNSR